MRTVGAPQRVAGRTPATPPLAVCATSNGGGTGRPCRSPRAPSLGTRPSPAVGPSLAAVEAGVGEMPRPCASACPEGRAAPAHRWGVRRCGPSMGETAWRWDCRRGRPLCGDWGWGWGDGGVKRRCGGRSLNCEEKIGGGGPPPRPPHRHGGLQLSLDGPSMVSRWSLDDADSSNDCSGKILEDVVSEHHLRPAQSLEQKKGPCPLVEALTYKRRARYRGHGPPCWPLSLCDPGPQHPPPLHPSPWQSPTRER